MNPLQKWIWKAFTGFHVFLYRISGGRFGSQMRGFGVLLLTTTGRKTGKRRTMPLGYIRDGDSYVVIASNGGLDRHPAWYFNLQQNPNVQIQVRERTLDVKAETAQGDHRQRLWSQVLAEAPGYADYQTRTTREIPLVILMPEGVQAVTGASTA